MFKVFAYLILSVVIGSGAVFSAAARADDTAPDWYQKKKQKEKDAEAVKAAKDAEKPVVGNGTGATTFAQLTSESPKPVAPNLLFDKRGLTDSLSFDYGSISQDYLNGLALSAQYAMGWWWHPNLVLSGFVRTSSILAETWLWFTFGVGPQIRWFMNHNWTLTASTGFNFSVGLTRVEETHIPPPPSADVLNGRNGLMGGLQLAYMFWSKKDLALGPSLQFWTSHQTDRTYTSVSIGLTLQSGRPEYDEDLTK